MIKKYWCVLIAGFCWISISAQNREPTQRQFTSDLLDHLVGDWKVASVTHGFSSSATLKGEWTLNHQIFHLHFKGKEIVPWIGVPMEFEYFIGYNHRQSKYIVHGVSVVGLDDDEGFWYGSRNGNQLIIRQPPEAGSTSDTVNVQRLTWKPETNTWVIQSRSRINGKEQGVFLDMRLTSVDTMK